MKTWYVVNRYPVINVIEVEAEEVSRCYVLKKGYSRKTAKDSSDEKLFETKEEANEHALFLLRRRVEKDEIGLKISIDCLEKSREALADFEASLTGYQESEKRVPGGL